MQLSIIIPAFKSAKFLEKNVSRICAAIKGIGKDYEILIVTGKNPDNTLQVARGIAAKNKNVKVIFSPERLGKGKALSLGFSRAKGETQVYTDADLEISPKYIVEIVKKIQQGFDVAIASKHNPKSRFESPFTRKFLGKSYNVLVRLVLGGSIRDYQGGLKGFKRNAIKKALPHVRDEWWFWDTEALMVSQWLGFRIGEIPIVGGYGFRGSTVNIFGTCFNLFKSVLNLKKRRLTELSKLKPGA